MMEGINFSTVDQNVKKCYTESLISHLDETSLTLGLKEITNQVKEVINAKKGESHQKNGEN